MPILIILDDSDTGSNPAESAGIVKKALLEVRDHTKVYAKDTCTVIIDADGDDAEQEYTKKMNDAGISCWVEESDQPLPSDEAIAA